MAEDAAQEALVTLHLRLPTLRSVAAFPLWLVRIVARICMSLFSPLWQRIEALQDESIEATDPADVELRIDLERAIEALPRGHREAILLFYYRGLPVADVAAQLGISREAAKVRLHRGRTLIRARLAGSGGEER